MIILYQKVEGEPEKQLYLQYIRGINKVIEKDDKLYISELQQPIGNDSVLGWVAVPEQPIHLPDAYLGEDGLLREQPPIGELNLTYFKAGELERLQRDPLAEIDELKARVVSLEAKRL